MTARDLALIPWQVRYTQRSHWRNRRTATMSLVFPLMFLAIFGSLNSGATIDTRAGLSYIDFYVPGIIAYAITLVCFNSTALGFAALRERGILKRVRTTPLPWGVYVAGAVGSTLLVMATSTLLLLAAGILLFGAHVQVHTLPGLVATIALGSTCLTLLGIGAAKLVPNPEGGMGVLMVITLPVMFISNVFYPLDGAPSWLQDVARAFPLRPLADGLQACFDPRTTGAGFVGHDLLTLALWTVAGAAIMLRYMRSLNRRT
ncbi:MAG TPA: ABC transporter permease [Conexibacter sp.]|jgi:ABC-2 type transport system permease protein|nr:ABC transporter permease [Conexibacter sp.]